MTPRHRRALIAAMSVSVIAACTATTSSPTPPPVSTVTSPVSAADLDPTSITSERLCAVFGDDQIEQVMALGKPAQATLDGPLRSGW